MFNIPNDFKNNIIKKDSDMRSYSKPGVWILFGTSKADESKCYCLDVGKNENIGKELKRNFDVMGNFRELKEEKHPYRNQFGQVMFYYPIYADRLDHLYHYISENYKDFFAIMIADSNDYYIEKYCAYLFKAKYWVSGRNSKNNSEEHIEKIKNSIPINEIKKKYIAKLYSEYMKQFD